ncbi:unnamed protein product [Brassica rapa subsp. trilocularis]
MAMNPVKTSGKSPVHPKKDASAGVKPPTQHDISKGVPARTVGCGFQSAHEGIKDINGKLQHERRYSERSSGSISFKKSNQTATLEAINMIGKRLDRLKKGNAKDSQSKVKLCDILYMRQEEAGKSALERIQAALLMGNLQSQLH